MLAVGADAAPPAGFYDRADGLGGPALRLALHRIISPHRRAPYGSLWEHYRVTDRRADGTVWDMYSDCRFAAFRSDQGGPPGTVGGYLTREHSWPKMAWGGHANDAYSDLFHVLPGDAHTNGQKGLAPPGEVGMRFTQCGLLKIGPARDGLGFRGEVFEPDDRYKGDFARIYLYFVVRYQTGDDALPCANWPLMQVGGRELAPWAEALLMRWHRDDPVDTKERDRNDAIHRIQGNRNPFVDHPEWAARIWDADTRPASTTSAPRVAPFLNGVDANYLPELEQRGARWRRSERDVQPLAEFAAHGVNAFRLRLWTGNTDTALELAAAAQQRGMIVHPVLFLSENWADYVKQPAPAAWRDLPFADKQAAVRNYARTTAQALRAHGLQGRLYAIGNEIDFGICGEFEERWDRRFALEWMRREIWPRAAAILVAAQAGLRDADSSAQFVVHLTQWWNPDFCRAMLATMRDHGVQVDAIGLSYYPSAPMSDERTMAVFFRNSESLSREFDCPVIVCEYAYPATERIVGQFADWNRAVPGYALTPEGQRRWIESFLSESRNHAHVAGAFYWSPEWYGDDLWQAFALFDAEGNARPALESLSTRGPAR